MPRVAAWRRLELRVSGTEASGGLDGVALFPLGTVHVGYAAIGTVGSDLNPNAMSEPLGPPAGTPYAIAEFDNLKIESK